MAAWQAQAHLATALEAASFAPEPPQGHPIPVGQGLYLNPSPLMGASCSGEWCSAYACVCIVVSCHVGPAV